jgi:hypothetical protein
MNDNNVQIKGFTYKNGVYVKNQPVSDLQAVVENGSKSRKVNKSKAKKNTN